MDPLLLAHPQTQRLEMRQEPPGRFYPSQSHPVDTTITVLHGHLWVAIGPERIWLYSGNHLFIPAGVPHEVTVGWRGCSFAIINYGHIKHPRRPHVHRDATNDAYRSTPQILNREGVIH